MVMPLHGLLQIGVSSLRSQQTALSVTSHNLSNVNTQGYTRQRADLSAERPISLIPGQVGIGVRTTGISRMRDTLLDNSIRTAAGRQAQYDVQGQNARELEGVFGDPANPDLNARMNEFFNGFQALTTAPENIGVRGSAIAQGQALADFFQQTSAAIDDLDTRLDGAVNSAATDINRMAEQVASLNRDIVYAEANGNQANDLRDQRDKVVEDLSGYFGLSVTEQPDGSLELAVNGEVFVMKFAFFPVQVMTAGMPPRPQIQSGGGVDLTTPTGSLQGIAQSYAANEAARTQVNSVAAALIQEVNSRHSAAFDLDGNTGTPFFTGTNAADIAVNPAVVGNPRRLAVAATNNRGNSDVAVQLSNLRDVPVLPGGAPTDTFDSSLTGLVTQLGTDARRAQDLGATHSKALETLREHRQSISGVNTDEELSNMVTFQRAYEAAARVVTSVDEMMDTIINRMGRVGL